MDIVIKIDDLSDGKVICLLEEHQQEMTLYSPPESIHALDKSKFYDPSLTFWSANVAGSFAGCGALMQLSNKHGEIKSMRTSKDFKRRGVAENILAHILQESTRRKYQRVSLETGTHDVFLPAIRLYQKLGFKECAPFGGYTFDPYSMFLSKDLTLQS